MEDCIVFEINKKPYIEQVETANSSVSFGVDDNGDGIWRRIGNISITSPGKEEEYLYVSEYAAPPSRHDLELAIKELGPKPCGA